MSIIVKNRKNIESIPGIVPLAWGLVKSCHSTRSIAGWGCAILGSHASAGSVMKRMNHPRTAAFRLDLGWNDFVFLYSSLCLNWLIIQGSFENKEACPRPAPENPWTNLVFFNLGRGSGRGARAPPRVAGGGAGGRSPPRRKEKPSF